MELQTIQILNQFIRNQIICMSNLPDVVATCPVGAAPNPPNVEPPRPELALVVAVLKPNEGAAAAGA